MIPIGRHRNVRLDQLVATQAALAIVLLGAARGGAIFAAAALSAAGFLALLWVRGNKVVRLGFRARRHTTRLDSPAAVLALAAPRTLITAAELSGTPAAVLVDDFGLTLPVELAEPAAALPALHTLLPAPTEDQPPARIQLVLTGAPAGRGAGPAAGSYRSLSNNRLDLLGQYTAMLAIRVPRTEGRSEDELRRALLGLARRLIRRLRTHAARPPAPDAVAQLITGLAHAEPVDEAHESWSALRLGGLHQATFGCGPIPARLLPRLLHLPVTATTVSVTADAGRAESLLIRLAAPDATALGNAARLLQRLLDPEGIVLRRWDGAHLAGLSATLPLGGGPGRATRPEGTGPATRSEPAGPATRSEPAGTAARSEPAGTPAITAGLLLGRNRDGAPVPVTLFRCEPARVLLVGSLACAQLLTFRALATGARVTVHSTRPQEWTAFVRGAGDPVTLLPGDQPPVVPAGSPRRPVLTVVDGAPEVVPIGPWQTTLMLSGRFTAADLTAATEADLVVLQPLEVAEAALLDEALHLDDAADHLTRMRPTMVALVSRSTIRWAVLAPTPIEKVLIGAIERQQIER